MFAHEGLPDSSPDRRGRMRGLFLVAALAAMLALVVVPAAPARAYAEKESTVAAELVLQAVGLMANGMDTAMVEEKIDAALKAPETEGVDLGQVRQAKAALEGKDVNAARTLLQSSLWPAAGQRAMGEETGTTVVRDPLNTQRHLDGGSWTVLGLSLALLALGVLLSLRYRPSERVRQLRRQLAELSTAAEPPSREP